MIDEDYSSVFKGDLISKVSPCLLLLTHVVSNTVWIVRNQNKHSLMFCLSLIRVSFPALRPARLAILPFSL